MKRPLLFFAGSLILGSILHECSILTIVFLCILNSAVCCLLLIKGTCTDCLVLLLSLFLVAGYLVTNYAMQPQEIQTELTSSRNGVTIGTVRDIERKQTYYLLWLEDCTVLLANRENEITVPKILVYFDTEPKCAIGNFVRIDGEIACIRRADNTGQFDEYSYRRAQGISCMLYHQNMDIVSDTRYELSDLICRIRRRFSEVCLRVLPEKEASVLLTMLSGDDSMLREETERSYRKSGITHILTISGLHVMLLGMLLFRLLNYVFTSQRLAVIVTISLMFCYGFLCGFGTATERAIWMLVVLLAARLFGRSYDMPSALGFAGILQLLMRPLQLFEAGFLLSYGAVMAIAFVVPILQRPIIKMRAKLQTENRLTVGKRFLLFCADTLSVSAGIQLVLTPILMYFFYEVTFVGVFANLIVLPLVSLLLPISFVSMLVCAISPLPFAFAAGLPYFLVVCLNTVAELFEKIPGGSLLTGCPSMICILLYYLLLGTLLWVGEYIKQVGPAFLLMICLLPFLIWSVEKPAVITMLSVGQGESILIYTPQGKVLLSDCGSTDRTKVGKYILLPFLQYHGIDYIDSVFLSHPDNDHFSGIVEILQEESMYGISIGSIMIPISFCNSEEAEEMYMLAKARQVPICFVATGDMVREEDFSMICLHPSVQFQSDDVNTASAVWLLSMEHCHVLLTGDISAREEKVLLKSITDYKLEISKKPILLKVAHHGSNYSSGEELLKTLTPEYAIISCGEGNSYGHPGKETMSRLHNVGTLTYVTAQQGMLQLFLHSGRLEIVGYR